jgi:hypothetical protein
LANRSVVAGNNGEGDIVFWQKKFVTALSESTFKETLSIRFANVSDVEKVDALLTKVANDLPDVSSRADVAAENTRCDNVGLDIGRMVP